MSDSTPNTAVYEGVKTAEGLYLLESEPVSVVVGTSPMKTWHLPKGLLVNASPYFAAAFKGSFAEATSKEIALPEESFDAFALFVRWLYVGEISGNIFCYGHQTSEDDRSGSSTSTSGDGTSFAITRMYLQACSLGDKLGCLTFLDLAVLEVIKLYSLKAIEAEAILYIYEHFAPGSKVRRFAIDQFRRDLQEGDYWGDVAPIISAARSVKDFGPDFLEATLEAKDRDAVEPQAHTELYMEVLTGTEED